LSELSEISCAIRGEAERRKQGVRKKKKLTFQLLWGTIEKLKKQLLWRGEVW